MKSLFHRRFKFLWNYQITGVETLTTRELHFRWKFWVVLEETAATSCQAKEQILRSKISFLPKNIWESFLILLLFLRNNVTTFILSIFSTEIRTHLEYPQSQRIFRWYGYKTVLRSERFLTAKLYYVACKSLNLLNNRESLIRFVDPLL